jgi:hypothetical protein
MTVDDILWGCAAIAEAIGRNARVTFYMLEKGRLPAKKIGRQWCASRKALLRALGSDVEEQHEQA